MSIAIFSQILCRLCLPKVLETTSDRVDCRVFTKATFKQYLSQWFSGAVQVGACFKRRGREISIFTFQGTSARVNLQGSKFRFSPSSVLRTKTFASDARLIIHEAFKCLHSPKSVLV